MIEIINADRINELIELKVFRKMIYDVIFKCINKNCITMYTIPISFILNVKIF